MTPQQTLVAVRKRGINIRAVDGKLRLSPANAVDNELRDALIRNKQALLGLLAGPRLGTDGRPVDQCAACGCPTWWLTADRWHCDHCEPRPQPFIAGRILVVAGGEWAKH